MPVIEADRPGNWSIGVFSASGSQVPGACLHHCLHGDPRLAGTHGCAMVRQLDRRWKGDNGATNASTFPSALPVKTAAMCDKGYVVSLQSAEEIGQPDVLVLRPGQESVDEVKPAIEALQTAASENWRLDQENQGLANEVLRSYEQINLIFDMSAQIAILNDAVEVRRMLLVKLRHLLDADSVFYISPERGIVKEVTRDDHLHRGTLSEDDAKAPESFQPPVPDSTEHLDADMELPPEFPHVLERLRKSRRVLVSSADAKHEQTGYGTSLWGPLSDGDTGFALVGIVRRAVPFVAGDMLVLDSVLTYGSHILSNLRLVEQLKRTSFEAVRALVNAIDQKDSDTYGHSERVGFLAKITGQSVGMTPKQLQQLEWAGLLHDVGKIGIPEHVLNKPGRLTDEEFALIKEHPSRSFEVLRPVASLEPVLDAVLYHHENPDGTGYPSGLKGEDIPLMARIIHVVDMFDALTSTRSYRGAYDVEHSIAIMKKDAGTKLDARIVEHFLEAWNYLPRTHPEQYKRWFSGQTSGERDAGMPAAALSSSVSGPQETK